MNEKAKWYICNFKNHINTYIFSDLLRVRVRMAEDSDGIETDVQITCLRL